MSSSTNAATDPTSTTTTTTQTTPSLITGHAQFLKGKAEEAIGTVVGSADWTAAGGRDVKQGVDVMREVNQARSGEPAASSIGGRVEQVAGKLTGCEGMEKEGIIRQEKAA